ncbi:EamA family transporter [Thermophilibacter sp. ET337]|uniref:EamA family transporter n=1 Tax=Thermophilibacter sp. ET337 TaxID=2973084 RepID=UPI0021ABFAA4|nr:EamA family transporter [Thermophilibacter sp. ET337]MCR8908432.1 EamA family transporter [Thermophilibacter sp. ET337]
MWLAFAAGSALFSGLTAILAKCGIRTTDSNVATAIRTIVVLAFSWLMVLVVGSAGTVSDIAPHTWVFLVLSGLSTGASWLFYFRALQLGDVNKITPVDKLSTVLTMVLGATLLHERFSVASAAAVALIGIGTLLMVVRGDDGKPAPNGGTSRSWLPYAVGSAVFAALTAILGKVGIEGVESNLGTAVRTVVVLVMAWLMVGVTGTLPQVRGVPPRELAFICLSGVATGAAWLCYYRALQEGPASVVAPVDKLSIVVTVVFSRVFLAERLSRRAAVGLALVVVGTIVATVA